MEHVTRASLWIRLNFACSLVSVEEWETHHVCLFFYRPERGVLYHIVILRGFPSFFLPLREAENECRPPTSPS